MVLEWRSFLLSRDRLFKDGVRFHVKVAPFCLCTGYGKLFKFPIKFSVIY